MHKKKIIFYVVFILLLIILIFLGIISIKQIRQQYLASKCIESLSNFDISSPFTINKIVYFSSANCTSNVNTNSSFTINNLYQSTDIAIFINNNANKNFNAENTLKKVTLSDIHFSLTPSIGTPKLFYKNINNFATTSYDENNIIENNLEFNVSSEDEIDYSTPTLFNNCANPITLNYINLNIKNDYTLTDNVLNLSYDGSLLKHCNITLNSIACKLNFLITIINNLDETYTCPLLLTIPLSTENSTIYDGSLTITDNTNYFFIKNKKR